MFHCVDLVDYPPPPVDAQKIEIVGVARARIVFDDFDGSGVFRYLDFVDSQLALFFLARAGGEHGVPLGLRQLAERAVAIDEVESRLRPERGVKTDGVVELEAVKVAMDDFADR